MTTLYVSGLLQAVNHRQGGWVSVEIMEPGRQYPRKLDTKREEIIAAATSMMGQPVTAKYNEVDSGTPNPHRPGTTFINRYLEQISLGFTDVSQLNAQAQPQPQPTMAMPMVQPMPQMTPQPQPQPMPQVQVQPQSMSMDGPTQRPGAP